MQTSSTAAARLGAKSGATARLEALTSAAAAAALGLVLLWGVGFAQIDAVHNAAHDTRHYNAFPCH